MYEIAKASNALGTLVITRHLASNCGVFSWQIYNFYHISV